MRPPILAKLRKRRPQDEATITILPSFFQELEENGNETGPFRKQPVFDFEAWQVSCKELFPCVLSRLLRKDILHEPPVLKLPKRFVPLWKDFDALRSDKKCLGRFLHGQHGRTAVISTTCQDIMEASLELMAASEKQAAANEPWPKVQPPPL